MGTDLNTGINPCSFAEGIRPVDVDPLPMPKSLRDVHTTASRASVDPIDPETAHLVRDSGLSTLCNPAGILETLVGTMP